jgi:hypothetical protein
MKKIAKIITVIIRRIIAVIKPTKGMNDYINEAKGVYKSMNGNSYYPAASLSITLAQYNTDVMALDAAETAFITTPPTVSKAFRDAAKRVVAKDLRLLLSDVQKLADATPAKAEDIITSANFAVKHSSAHDKFIGVRNTGVSGTVKITAPQAGPQEWAMLANDGVTWISLRSTKNSKKTVRDLTPLKRYTFRCAPIHSDNEEPAEWTVFEPFLVL